MKRAQEAEARQKKALEQTAKVFWPKLKDAFVAKGYEVTIPKNHLFGAPNTDKSFDKIDGIRIAMALRPARLKYVGEDPSDQIRFYVFEQGTKIYKPSKRRGGEFDYAAIVNTVSKIVEDAKKRQREDEEEAQTIKRALILRTRLVNAVCTNPEEQKAFLGPYDLTGQPFPNLPRGGLVRLTVNDHGVGLKIDAPIPEEVMLELLLVCKKHGYIQ